MNQVERRTSHADLKAGITLKQGKVYAQMKLFGRDRAPVPTQPYLALVTRSVDELGPLLEQYFDSIAMLGAILATSTRISGRDKRYADEVTWKCLQQSLKWQSKTFKRLKAATPADPKLAPFHALIVPLILNI